MNSRATNDSNFRYGHLEIFDKIFVLELIESSHFQEVYPSTSLDLKLKTALDLNSKQTEVSILK